MAMQAERFADGKFANPPHPKDSQGCLSRRHDGIMMSPHDGS